ncbi:hypothetical protein U1Q18_025799, partial [Sarracenia purpurea var. burkii]
MHVASILVPETPLAGANPIDLEEMPVFPLPKIKDFQDRLTKQHVSPFVVEDLVEILDYGQEERHDETTPKMVYEE